MSTGLIERAPTTSLGNEDEKPKTGIYSDKPIDYAAAAERYAIEAQDPTLSPLEKQAKEDIVSYTTQRAKEIAAASEAAQAIDPPTVENTTPESPENS